jgi:hypothetical protein
MTRYIPTYHAKKFEVKDLQHREDLEAVGEEEAEDHGSAGQVREGPGGEVGEDDAAGGGRGKQGG